MFDFFLVLKVLGFPVAKAKRVFAEIKDQPDIGIWQEGKIWEIVQFHFRHNEFYRIFIGDVPGRWEDIPIITKNDLQGEWRNKIPIQTKNAYVSSTSGASGRPFYFAKDRLTHVLCWLNVADKYRLAGISINDLQARFYGIPISGAAYYKEKIKDYFSNRKRFPVFDLSDSVLSRWVELFGKSRFRYLYGYTNSLVVFSKYLIEQKKCLRNICPSLRACVVTSEMCSDDDRALLEQGFGLPVYNEYGASEVCVIGFRQGEEWRVSDEIVYLEVVDDLGRLVADGELGRILCTLFHNEGTPIIRYEIGDFGAIERRNGHTFITKLIGRTNDMVVLPSGRKVPGLTFYYVASSLLNLQGNIREFRIVQKEATGFVIEVVVHDPLKLDTVAMLSCLQDGFDKYLERGMKVSLSVVNHIHRDQSGKLKQFNKLLEH